jgi:hypothetical protein
MAVTDKLIPYFQDIMNVEFTAQMEDNLDKIEEGQRKWVDIVKAFYEPFKRAVDFIAALLGIGQHRPIDMDDDLIPLARSEAVDRRIGRDRQLADRLVLVGPDRPHDDIAQHRGTLH